MSSTYDAEETSPPPETSPVPGASEGSSLAPGGMPSLAPDADPMAGYRREEEEIRLRSLRKSEQLTDKMEKEIDRGADIRARRADALNPRREEALAAIGQPIPPSPTPQPLPAVPTSKMDDSDHAWLNAAMFLGSLAGATTRNHLTNALAGLAGATQGFQQGRMDMFNQAMDTWRASTEKALKENDRAQKVYENILKNRQMSIDQKMMEMQIVAQKFDDEAMGSQAALKDTAAVAQLVDTRARYAAEMRRATASLDAQRFELAEQEVAKTPDTTRGIAEYRLPPPPASGAGAGRAMYEARMRAVQDINPTYDVKRWLEISRGAAAKGAAEGRFPTQSALRQMGLFGPFDARQVRNQNTAFAHLDTLKQLSGQLDNTDIPRINEVKQRLFTELGFPAPTNFDAARQIIGNEIVLAITRTGGGVYDRREINEQLSKARSPDQLNGMIDVYQRLIAAQTASARGQYDFSRKLTPNAPKFEEMIDHPILRQLIARPDRTGFTVTRGTPENEQQLLDTWRREAQQQFDAIAPPDRRSGLRDDINAVARKGGEITTNTATEVAGAARKGAEMLPRSPTEAANMLDQGVRDLGSFEREMLFHPADEMPHGEVPGTGRPFELPEWLNNILPEGWQARPIPRGAMPDMPIPPRPPD